MTSKALEGLLTDEKISSYLKANPDVANNINTSQQQFHEQHIKTTSASKIVLGILLLLCLLILWKYFTEIRTLQSKIQTKTSSEQH